MNSHSNKAQCLLPAIAESLKSGDKTN